MKVWMAILTVAVLSACSKEPEKTELQLHFEKALRDTQSIVDQANDILDNKVANDPINNLAQLVYAKEVADRAAKVFKEAKITGVEQPELDRLYQKLHSNDPKIAQKAIQLMQEMAEKTIALRQRIDDIKSQPYSVSKKASTENMVDYLGDQYNEDIKNCCLDDLYRINSLLRVSPDKKYHQVSRHINSAIDDLTNILKEESGGDKYKAALVQLSNNIE